MVAAEVTREHARLLSAASVMPPAACVGTTAAAASPPPPASAPTSMPLSLPGLVPPASVVLELGSVVLSPTHALSQIPSAGATTTTNPQNTRFMFRSPRVRSSAYLIADQTRPRELPRPASALLSRLLEMERRRPPPLPLTRPPCRCCSRSTAQWSHGSCSQVQRQCFGEHTRMQQSWPGDTYCGGAVSSLATCAAPASSRELDDSARQAS